MYIFMWQILFDFFFHSYQFRRRFFQFHSYFRLLQILFVEALYSDKLTQTRTKQLSSLQISFYLNNNKPRRHRGNC